MYRATTWLTAGSLVLATGCITIKGDGDSGGTSTAQAAEALTKALAFEGGELVEGLMPPSSTSSVSLVPFDDAAMEPGAAALMSFDVAPGDATLAGALVQFEGAKSHFLVDGDSLGGGGGGFDAGSALAADGGSGSANPDKPGPRPIELSYSVSDSVCDKLCDTQYAIKVTLAVSLPGEKVSKHVTATVTLDCRKHGDHDKCGDKNKPSVEQVDSGEPVQTDRSDAARPPTGVDVGVDASVDPGGAGSGFQRPDATVDPGGEAGSGGTQLADCATLGEQDRLISYDNLYAQAVAAASDPAVTDCSVGMECGTHTNAGTSAGSCIIVSLDYDAVLLDIRAKAAADAYGALSAAEQACRPLANGNDCPLTVMCVSGVCTAGGAIAAPRDAGL